MCVKLPPNVIVLLPLFIPVPPYVGSIIVACQTPVFTVPNCCKLLLTTVAPIVVELNTLFPSMRNCLPLASSKFSLLVQLSVEFIQLIVLSVAPLSVIPPPSAVTSVGESSAPSSMFLSSTLNSVVLIVVVVPFTVKSPVTVRSLLTVVVPVLAPTLTLVASPPPQMTEASASQI